MNRVVSTEPLAREKVNDLMSQNQAVLNLSGSLVCSFVRWFVKESRPSFHREEGNEIRSLPRGS